MNKLKVTEVAVIIGKSVQTINMWYAWKREHPDDEIAKLLPDYTQEGKRRTRYWDKSDIWKFAVFISAIKTGRNGFMGDITQKYVKKEN